LASNTYSVTQKGQITIPKDIRDKLGLKEYDRVMVTEKDNKISIEPVKDILDIVGKGLTLHYEIFY